MARHDPRDDPSDGGGACACDWRCRIEERVVGRGVLVLARRVLGLWLRGVLGRCGHHGRDRRWRRERGRGRRRASMEELGEGDCPDRDDDCDADAEHEPRAALADWLGTGAGRGWATRRMRRGARPSTASDFAGRAPAPGGLSGRPLVMRACHRLWPATAAGAMRTRARRDSGLRETARGETP